MRIVPAPRSLPLKHAAAVPRRTHRLACVVRSRPIAAGPDRARACGSGRRRPVRSPVRQGGRGARACHGRSAESATSSSLGADVCIDYRNAGWADAIASSVDLVLDGAAVRRGNDRGSHCDLAHDGRDRDAADRTGRSRSARMSRRVAASCRMDHGSANRCEVRRGYVGRNRSIQNSRWMTSWPRTRAANRDMPAGRSSSTANA